MASRWRERNQNSTTGSYLDEKKMSVQLNKYIFGHQRRIVSLQLGHSILILFFFIKNEKLNKFKFDGIRDAGSQSQGKRVYFLETLRYNDDFLLKWRDQIGKRILNFFPKKIKIFYFFIFSVMRNWAKGILNFSHRVHCCHHMKAKWQLTDPSWLAVEKNKWFYVWTRIWWF